MFAVSQRKGPPTGTNSQHLVDSNNNETSQGSNSATTSIRISASPPPQGLSGGGATQTGITTGGISNSPSQHNVAEQKRKKHTQKRKWQLLLLLCVLMFIYMVKVFAVHGDVDSGENVNGASSSGGGLHHKQRSWNRWGKRVHGSSQQKQGGEDPKPKGNRVVQEENNPIVADSETSKDVQPQQEHDLSGGVGAGGFEDLSSTFKDGRERRAYRRSIILEEIDFSFQGYRDCAWGHDELRPVSCTHKDWSYKGLTSSRARQLSTHKQQKRKNEGDEDGLALTMIDSLTTLILANQTHHVEAVLEYLRERPKFFNIGLSVSQFETTIRLVGGLISAYELLGENPEHKFLIDLAQDVGERLLNAYKKTTTSGQSNPRLPNGFVDLKQGNASNEDWDASIIVLSEIGSNGLEFRALSYHTGDKRFAEVVATVTNILLERCPPSQLCPTYFNQMSGEPTNDEVSLGGLSDSYYEYLLKMYVHSGYSDLPSLSRFLRFFESARKRDLVQSFDAAAPSLGSALEDDRKKTESLPRSWLNIVSGENQVFNKMDHLSCFAGGLFRLGYETVDFFPGEGKASSALYDTMKQSQELTYDSETMARELLESGIGVTETCVDLYAKTKSGMGPEIASLVNPKKLKSARPMVGSQPYLLRPEAVESLFYQHYFDATVDSPLIGSAANGGDAAKKLKKERREKLEELKTSSSVYEEQAWGMYLNIRRMCRAPYGYSGITSVDFKPMKSRGGAKKNSHQFKTDVGSPFQQDDIMQSFWMAETMKYLLLMFTEMHSSEHEPNKMLNLHAMDGSGWVFNTEAHPLKIREDLLDKVMVL